MLPKACLGFIFFLILLSYNESGGILGVEVSAKTIESYSPSDIVQIIQDTQVKQVHISDADHQLLGALAGTGVQVTIGIANEQLQHIAEFQEEADDWIRANILPFIPATHISYVIAGNDATSSTDHAPFLVPAMRNLCSALAAANLHGVIKVSSSHSTNFTLDGSSSMAELLQFLNETDSSLFLNIDNSSGTVHAAYHSMQELGFSGIPVIVSEFQGLKSGDTLIYSNSKLSYVEPRARRILATGSAFCVAKPNADQTALQAGLNYACGQSPSSCTNIQPGGSCYKANNLVALASYAYNDYYHKFVANGATCDFSGTAMTTTTDPSYGSCIFAGSTQASNSSVTPFASPPSNTGGLSPPSAFGPPSTFTNGSFGPSGLVPVGFGSTITPSRLLIIVYLVSLMLCFFPDI